jgi:hypothetical protein
MGEYILKENPQVKIVLFNDRFELHRSNVQMKEYMLTEVDSFEIGKKINWLVSLLSFAAGIFLGGSGDVYNDRDRLTFNYKNQPISCSLIGCDPNIALKARDAINEKIRHI